MCSRVDRLRGLLDLIDETPPREGQDRQRNAMIGVAFDALFQALNTTADMPEDFIVRIYGGETNNV